jgi:membrane protease YdiL (CAAX protease family)
MKPSTGRAQGATRNTAAVLAGLALAWGGTLLLISPPLNVLRDPSRPWLLLTGTVVFWGLAALVIGGVIFWERQPLRSLWLQPFSYKSIAWGILLVALNYSAFAPIGEWVRRSAGLSGFSTGMQQITGFPLWYRVLAVAGAGIIEELLFRGFTVTRLIALTGRTWLAALLALAGFSLLHLPLWGIGYVVSILFSGAAAMAFFIWRKDLLAMIVYHTITDAIGILAMPALYDWWQDPAFR